jgi:hypothetical protein
VDINGEAMNYMTVVMLIFIAGHPSPVEVERFEDMPSCVAAIHDSLRTWSKDDVTKVECWTNVPGETP